jgi:hypothetical protein
LPVLALAMMLAAGAAMADPNDVGKLLSGDGWNLSLIEPTEPAECSGVVNIFPSTAQTGYVILREELGGGTKYSDIMIITNLGHKPTGIAGDAGDRVILVSESTEGAGVTDADLGCVATAGLPAITLADIAAADAAGFLKRRAEVKGPFTSWTPTGMNYDIHSAGDTNLPGVSPAILLFMFGLLGITGVLVLRRKRGAQSMSA